jgi:predicted transcriptional regulator
MTPLADDGVPGGAATFARSPHRIEILQTLLSTPMEKRTLAEELDIPRATVRDNINKLMKNGLVEELPDRRYRTTTRGELVYDAYEEYLETLEITSRLSSFLEHIDFTHLNLGIRALADAEVQEPEQTNPQAPTHQLVSSIDDTTCVTGWFPRLTPMVLRAITTGLERRGIDVTFICPHDVWETLQTEYVSAAEQLLKLETADVATLVGCPDDFGIIRLDDRVVIRTFDTHGKPHAIVVSQRSDCIKWAEQRLETLRSRGSPPEVPAAEPIPKEE